MVLTEALGFLRRDGWCKDALFALDGRMCAVGAVEVATGVSRSVQFSELYFEEILRLAQVIAEEYPGRCVPGRDNSRAIVVDFNNHPQTTFEDVERVFEKAAAG